MLRPAGVLLICLALGGLLSLALSSRFSSIYIGPVETIAECVRVDKGRWLVVASSEEIEVPSMEGVSFLAQVDAHSVSLLPSPPSSRGGPSVPSPIPTVFESSNVYVLDEKVGRAKGLPWTAGAPSTAPTVASEAPSLATASSSLSSPDWAQGEFVEGEIQIPEGGKWYVVFVGEATIGQSLPSSGINHTVECFVDVTLSAKIKPELDQFLRAAYLLGVGALLIALDWIRRRRGVQPAPA